MDSDIKSEFRKCGEVRMSEAQPSETDFCYSPWVVAFFKREPGVSSES